MAKNQREQLNEDERKILTELQKNCKENMDVIAGHCGFSKQKVWRIIKQLEKNHIIWGYPTVYNEEKQKLQKFILLIKRSVQKIDNQTAEQLISYQKNKDIGVLGVTVENSYFSHGEYDWILIFTAQDITRAKKFTDVLLNRYPGMVSKVNLIQILMTLRSQHILNPDYMKLREFL